MKYKDQYHSFYTSVEWRRFRESVLSQYNYQCADCKARNIIRAAKAVHHIKPIDKFWDLRFDYDNCIPLCNECHNARHERSNGLLQFMYEWG